MSEHDDLELARRLRDHYRTTAAGEVPASLRATVRAGVAPGRASRWRWIGPRAAAAAVLTVVLGTALILGARPSRPVLPAATMSAADPGGSGFAASGPPASVPPAPSSGVVAGEVAVLRGKAIRDAALAATNESPFLIGGRTAFVQADCAVATNFPETPLLRVCGDGLVIGDERPFGIPLVTDFLPSGPGLGFNEPAVVVRVRTHDARAADCPPAYRVRCDQALVVEQVVWRPEAGRSATIPAVMSILAPQVNPEQCTALRFSFIRCIAVTERARSIGSIPWPEVTAVRLDPPGPEVSLGSTWIAVVSFHLRTGRDVRIDVRCMLSEMRSVPCGTATVQVVPLEPGSPTP